MRARRLLRLIIAVALAAGAFLATVAPAAAAPGDRIWVETYPAGPYAEEFRDLAPGPNGSVYAVGVAEATEETSKLLVARYDADGERRWVRVWGAGGAGASGYRAVAVHAGLVVVGTVGNVSSPHRTDIVIARYSASGELLWTTRYDGPGHRDDNAAGVVIGEYGDGGRPSHVYVGGTSFGAGTGRDYVLLRVRVSDGRVGWARRYAGPGGRDELRAMYADARGNVFVTGVSADRGGGTAAATLRYHRDGSRRWLRRLHAGAGPTSGAGVSVKDSRGSVPFSPPEVHVAGTTSGGMSSGDEVMLASLAYADGVKQWTQTAGYADGNEAAIAFAPSSLHGDAIAGLSSDRVSQAPRAYVAVWDPLDVFARQDVYPPAPATDDGGFAAVVRAAGGALFCGGTVALGDVSPDLAVVCYAVDGAILWDATFDGAAHDTDLCRAVLLRGDGLYACGSVGRGGLNTSALLVKYER